MRMSGGRVRRRRRSAAGVSPERTPTPTGTTGAPSSAAASAIPASGRRRFRSTSTPRALSGDMYSTRTPRRPWPGGLPSRVAPRPGGGSRTSRSMADRKAASVLPEPVGAMTSAFSPRSMAAQARSWTGVGPSGKTEPNQARVAGAKASGSPGAAIGSAVMRPVWRESRHESRDATAPAGSTSRGTGAPSQPPPRRRSSEPRLARNRPFVGTAHETEGPRCGRWGAWDHARAVHVRAVGTPDRIAHAAVGPSLSRRG